MMYKSLLKTLCVVFLLFVAWIIYSADVGHSNIFFNLVDAIPNGDKLGHFFLFGILTLLANLSLNFRTISFYKPVPVGTIIVSVVILVEELSQAFFPNRTLDVIDLFADGLGVLCFTYLGFWLHANFFAKTKN